MKLDHINIMAPGKLLEQEKTFFCSVLGLHEGYRPVFSRDGYWLYANDKPIVHLTESDEHFRSDQQGFLDHIAFRSSDLAALVERLTTQDVDHSIVYLEEAQLSQVFVKTPSGTGIEINFHNEKI